MSRKTRKEKILADLRRKLKSEDSSPTINLPSSTFNSQLPELSGPPKREIANKNNTVQNASLYIYPVQLIRKDLTKTLLLCILAISLEIALFLILEKYLILPFRIRL